MNINEKIRTILEQNNISQKEIALKTGIPSSTLNNYLKKGTTISIENFKKLIDALEIDANQILNEDIQNTEINHTVVINDVTNQFMMVPVLRLRSCAGCGNGYEKIQWDSIGNYPIKQTDVIGYAWQGGELKIIGINGTSMEPKFHDGDYALFTTNTDNLQNGDIVVALWDGRIYIRGFFVGKDKITLKPMNPIVPELNIDFGDKRLYFVGKVIARVPRLEKESGFFA